MKKRYLFLVTACVVLACTCPLFSQNVSLIPKEVYVGDEAEIRFEFDWKGDLVSEGATLTAELVNDAIIDETLERDYTIKSMQLFPNKNGYTVSILFVPWKAGLLDIASFDLATIFSLEVNSLLIDIPEVKIESILKSSGTDELNPPVAPVIIPGTSYALVAIFVLGFIVILGIIIILIRLKFIKMWIRSFMAKTWRSRNFKKAAKNLLAISRQLEPLETKKFATDLSLVVRTYLEGRFLHPFTAETTSSFLSIFDGMFAGTASSSLEENFHELYEICVRCDFLHYAENEVEKAPLTIDEARMLIEKAKKAFLYFERDADDEGIEGGKA